MKEKTESENSLIKLVGEFRKEKLTSWIDDGGKFPRLIIEGNKEISTDTEIFKALIKAVKNES